MKYLNEIIKFYFHQIPPKFLIYTGRKKILYKREDYIIMPIVIDEEACEGKPIIKGTRIQCRVFILELLSNGWSYEEILKNYPQLKKEGILEAIKYAVEVLKEEKIYIFPKEA